MAANGTFSNASLSSIPGGQLTKSAAKSWNAFVRYCRVEHGVTLEVTDSYRRLGARGDLANGKWSQWAAWERHQQGGNLAAYPGTSNHGLGIALDVPSPTQNAIARWGAPFGWQKKWSDATNEPWHFRYSSVNAQRKVIAKWSQVRSNETIVLGDRGPGVRALKVLLRRHGNWPARYPLNNGYGRVTLWHVKKFQKKNKLTPNGRVGPATWKALRKK